MEREKWEYLGVKRTGSDGLPAYVWVHDGRGGLRYVTWAVWEYRAATTGGRA